jgi:hypothetical protein
MTRRRLGLTALAGETQPATGLSARRQPVAEELRQAPKRARSLTKYFLHVCSLAQRDLSQSHIFFHVQPPNCQK